MVVNRKNVIQTILHLLLGLCVSSLALIVPVFAQGIEEEDDREIRVATFKLLGTAPKNYKDAHKGLAQKLPRALTDHMQQTMKYVDRVEQVETDSATPGAFGLDEYPTDSTFRCLCGAETTPGVYVLAGRYWYWGEQDRMTAEAILYECKDGKRAFHTSVLEQGGNQAGPGLEERIVSSLARNIDMRFSGGIRVGLINFKQTGGDTNTYSFLKEAIPTMLATRLSASRGIKLVEIRHYTELVLYGACSTLQAKVVQAAGQVHHPISQPVTP